MRPTELSRPNELAQCARSWAARRLDPEQVDAVTPEDRPPRHGDLCCVRVLQVGHPAHAVLADGERRPLHVDEHLWVLWEGPDPPSPQGQLSGGLPPGALRLSHPSGLVTADSEASAGDLTRVRLVARGLRRDGRACNVRHGARALPAWNERVPPVMLLLPAHAGVATDAPTWAAARLARRCRADGLSVGALQLTGAAADPNLACVAGAGATPVLDLADAGLCSTQHVPDTQLVRAYLHRLNLLAEDGVDLALAVTGEHALTPAVCALVQSSALRRSLRGVVFVHEARDRRAPTASSMFAALDVPMVAGTPETGSGRDTDAGRDDMHELASLLGGGTHDFEVTRPAWWLPEG